MDYPIHFAEQLSQHLKAFRKTRSLTQAQLAMHLGLTQSRIADIETNPGKVSLENLLKVLAALDVRMLLRDEAKESIPSATQRKPKTLAELKAMKDWPNLKGEDW
jgi:HTH-type transcriptional regulator / antitoxin HipB